VGVDPKDLPALQRVSALPDEAVYPTDLHFPGTYDRFGRYEPGEETDQQESLGDGEDETQAAGSDEDFSAAAELVPQQAELSAGELETDPSSPEQSSAEVATGPPSNRTDSEGT
jgi:hypothetical protein